MNAANPACDPTSVIALSEAGSPSGSNDVLSSLKLCFAAVHGLCTSQGVRRSASFTLAEGGEKKSMQKILGEASEVIRMSPFDLVMGRESLAWCMVGLRYFCTGEGMQKSTVLTFPEGEQTKSVWQLLSDGEAALKASAPPDANSASLEGKVYATKQEVDAYIEGHLQGLNAAHSAQELAGWQGRANLGGRWSDWKECKAPDPNEGLEVVLGGHVAYQFRPVYLSLDAIMQSLDVHMVVPRHLPVDSELTSAEEMRALLAEVSANFTRPDDLPDDLLTRIDAVLAEIPKS